MSEEQNRASRTENAINKVPVNPDYLAQYIEEDNSLDSLKTDSLRCATVIRFSCALRSNLYANNSPIYAKASITGNSSDDSIQSLKSSEKYNFR